MLVELSLGKDDLNSILEWAEIVDIQIGLSDAEHRLRMRLKELQ